MQTNNRLTPGGAAAPARSSRRRRLLPTALLLAATLLVPGVAHASGDGYPLPPPDVIDEDLDVDRPDEVLDAVRVVDDVDQVPVEQVPVAVEGTEVLAVTGVDTTWLLLGGALLALAGGVLIRGIRRRGDA